MAYVDVNGVRTYYEKHGTGDAVILLHGGLVGSDLWAAQTAALAEHYQVFTVDRRGHGRTPDVEGRLTYRMMAQDTIDFMTTIGLASAHLVGWSDGAMVGALVALQQPELVEKLVLIGQFLNPAGAVPLIQQLFGLPLDEMATHFGGPEFQKMYEEVTADGPEHFGVFVEKVMRMWKEDEGIPLEDLAGITAPTLVLQGDDDGVRVEHSAAVVAALPEAQLGVVPGTSHGMPLEKPELLNSLLLEFLGSEHPAKLFTLDG